MTTPIGELPEGTVRMLAAAAERGLPVELRERPAARNLEEAAAMLGVTPADIAKTMVAKLSGDRYLLVVLGGDRQIAWPKLRALVGVNKMSMPSADEALRATGYARGTITPVGSLGDWPVYVDADLVGRRVALGSGGPGHSAFLSIDDLVRAYDATVADIGD